MRAKIFHAQNPLFLARRFVPASQDLPGGGVFFFCRRNLKNARKISSKTTMATGRLGDDFRAATQVSHPDAFARVAKDMRAVDTAWCGRRIIAGACTGLPDKQGEVR